MAQSNFFAMISRLKYIDRWALMRNTHEENLSELCMETACIAHALAVIGNRRLASITTPSAPPCSDSITTRPRDADRRMPTPVKYYSPHIREAYAQVETERVRATLFQCFPRICAPTLRRSFFKDETDEELWKLVKAADKICAYIKCIEEKKAGNTEFDRAAESTLESINALDIPEAEEFMKEFFGRLPPDA